MRYTILFALLIIGCTKQETPQQATTTNPPITIKHTLRLEVTPKGIPYELYLSTIKDRKRLVYGEKLTNKTIKEFEFEYGDGLDLSIKWGTNIITAPPSVIIKVIQDDSLVLVNDTSNTPMTSKTILVR